MHGKRLLVFLSLFFWVIIIITLVLLWPIKPRNSPLGRLIFGLAKIFSAEKAARIVTARPPDYLNVPILLYHYIEDNQDERDFLRTSLATRPYFFDLQMRYLSGHGYQTVSLSDLREALAGRVQLPEKSVILTFDDGFRDHYENAFPILRKYGLKAIVFMIAQHLDLAGNLTETMLREMVDSGTFELGSHTLNHVWLSEVSRDEARREIFESRRILSERFRYPVKHFAYPGGFEAPWVIDLVREAGYETAVSTRVGQRQTGGEIWRLKRLKVGNLGEKEFVDLLEGRRSKEE